VFSCQIYLPSILNQNFLKMAKKTNMKCLIVDDDNTFLIYLKIIFEQTGFDVTSCSSVDEALNALKKTDFHLIISDIDMPIKDGFNFVEELKSNSKTKDIPVVFVTNVDDQEDIDRAFKLGVNGFIKKPFLRSQIRNIIDIMLGNKNDLINI